jgi:glucosyl-3-phosphoglycerate synthase
MTHEIDPALGLNLVAERTLKRHTDTTVSVIIPAHNEAETIREVVTEARRGLDLLQVRGDVLVSASGCTDDTAKLAREAGARAIEAPIGKGAAIAAGLDETAGDVVCLIDGDIRYFGDEPLSSLLIRPILNDICDACVTDLYWRPLYPQLWLLGFFAPLAGALYPEILPKVGSTPWSGQRAARREFWPAELPDDFTVDLELLFHWNRAVPRLRPIVADDWVNPQRPKPELMHAELDVVLRHALEDDRIGEDGISAIKQWFDEARSLMATYRPDTGKPQEFEHQLLRRSLQNLRHQLQGVRLNDTP